MCLRTLILSVSVFAFAFSFESSAAEGAKVTPATTRGATTQADAARGDRLEAELDRAWKDVFPADLRKAKGEPKLTDEQKFLAHYLQIILITSEATPERVAEAEKNRAHDPERLAAYEKSRKSVREDLAGEPEEVIVETEKAYDAEIEEIRLFQKMVDSPVTRGATQEQVELRAMEKIRDLPSLVRKVTVAGTEAAYHAGRAKVLGDIADLSKQLKGEGDAAGGKHLKARVEALRELLKAMDQREAAQQRVFEVTPLGWLNNVNVEK